MRIILLLIVLMASSPVQAQIDREAWNPQLTEQWDPEPTVVTPGDGTAPPSDAIILFDGSSVDAWQTNGGEPAGWRIDADGALTVVAGSGGIQTRETFGDIQLHLEWRSPTEIVGESQGRGNSGVFLQGLYEVQILDSYENRTYANGQAGSIYKQYAPLVNAMRPPGAWQTYDMVFEAPVFDDDGDVVKPAFATVFHNGVLIQHRVELRGTTEYRGLPAYSPHGDGPIGLQDHGNPVSFRNIWVRPL